MPNTRIVRGTYILAFYILQTLGNFYSFTKYVKKCWRCNLDKLPILMIYTALINLYQSMQMPSGRILTYREFPDHHKLGRRRDHLLLMFDTLDDLQ